MSALGPIILGDILGKSFFSDDHFLTKVSIQPSPPERSAAVMPEVVGVDPLQELSDSVRNLFTHLQSSEADVRFIGRSVHSAFSPRSALPASSPATPSRVVQTASSSQSPIPLVFPPTTPSPTPQFTDQRVSPSAPSPTSPVNISPTLRRVHGSSASLSSLGRDRGASTPISAQHAPSPLFLLSSPATPGPSSRSPVEIRGAPSPIALAVPAQSPASQVNIPFAIQPKTFSHPSLASRYAVPPELFVAVELWERMIAPLKEAWVSFCSTKGINHIGQAPYFASKAQRKLWLYYARFNVAVASGKNLSDIELEYHPKEVEMSRLHEWAMGYDVEVYINKSSPEKAPPLFLL